LVKYRQNYPYVTVAINYYATTGTSAFFTLPANLSQVNRYYTGSSRDYYIKFFPWRLGTLPVSQSTSKHWSNHSSI